MANALLDKAVEMVLANLLTLEQVSELKGIPRRTLSTWCATGYVDAYLIFGAYRIARHTLPSIERPKRGPKPRGGPKAAKRQKV